MLPEGEKELISFSFRVIRNCLKCGAALLRAGGTTLVYSYDVRAGKMGFLRTDRVARGDKLVFVPGFSHHLLLRRQGQTTARGVRWKLVGLVAIGKKMAKGGHCSESEWAQFLKDGAVINILLNKLLAQKSCNNN